MHRFRKIAADLCLLLSAFSIVYGVGLLSRPAAFVVIGALLAVSGLILAKTEDPRS